MTQGVKSANDAAEIDRIIQEIEEMEKSIDDVPKSQDNSAAQSAPVSSTPATASDAASQIMAAAESVEEVPVPQEEPVAAATTESNNGIQSDNVVPMRRGPAAASEETEDMLSKSESVRVEESLAESDAVPAPRGSLQFERATSESGDLAMKIGGCTSVSLEFERAGIRVSLSCDDEGLTISTDNGAEFRVPFRKAA